MANIAQVAVDLPEHEYLNTTNVKTATVVRVVPNETSLSKAARISAILALILFTIGSAIPILQLYIGRRYGNQCPIDAHIPNYLVVAGVVGILIAILGWIENILSLKVATNRVTQTLTVGPAAVLFGVIALLAILMLFFFVWFIAGCIWIFRVRNFVQYDNPNENTYCHPVLYRFAYWLLLISLFFECITCCLSCAKSGSQLKILRDARSMPTSVYS